MCLGASARAANKAARNQYKYQLQKRKSEWMQTLSLEGVKRVQYEEGINNSRLGVAQVNADIQEKYGNLIGEAMQQDEANWKEFLQKNTSTDMIAAGRTGRSVGRISNLDLAEYLQGQARTAHSLTKARTQLTRAGQEAAGKARAEQMQMFADNAFVKHPDLAPPRPPMQNVTLAAIKDGLSIAGSVAGIAGNVATVFKQD